MVYLCPPVAMQTPMGSGDAYALFWNEPAAAVSWSIVIKETGKAYSFSDFQVRLIQEGGAAPEVDRGQGP